LEDKVVNLLLPILRLVLIIPHFSLLVFRVLYPSFISRITANRVTTSLVALVARAMMAMTFCLLIRVVTRHEQPICKGRLNRLEFIILQV